LYDVRNGGRNDRKMPRHDGIKKPGIKDWQKPVYSEQRLE
jgi:hypothetical protein